MGDVKPNNVSNQVNKEVSVAYTATWVVYWAFDRSLNEFLPGPAALKTVVLSALSVTWLPDTDTKPSAWAVASVT